MHPVQRRQSSLSGSDVATFAQEVLPMHGISSEPPWKIMPHLCFYRDSEKTEKEEQAAVDKTVTKEEFQGGWTTPALQFHVYSTRVGGPKAGGAL